MNGFQSSASNELFLERLDAFTAKTLADIKAFSTRENIPYDQVGCNPLYFPHRVIPELLYLRFGVMSQKDTHSIFSETRLLHRPVNKTVRFEATTSSCFSHSYCKYIVATAVRNVLLSTSRVLESLQATSGVQSFVLAINPNDAEDEGFLGGSSLGREFWRNLRGGGMAGVKALKSLAVSTLQDSSSPSVTLVGTGLPSRQKETAHSLKSEVYARVRTLLRHVFHTPCHFT